MARQPGAASFEELGRKIDYLQNNPGPFILVWENMVQKNIYTSIEWCSPEKGKSVEVKCTKTDGTDVWIPVPMIGDILISMNEYEQMNERIDTQTPKP